jgi:hypothetical protein
MYGNSTLKYRGSGKKLRGLEKYLKIVGKSGKIVGKKIIIILSWGSLKERVTAARPETRIERLRSMSE